MKEQRVSLCVLKMENLLSKCVVRFIYLLLDLDLDLEHLPYKPNEAVTVALPPELFLKAAVL